MNRSLVWRSSVIFIVLCLTGSICQAATIPQIALGGGYECILFIRNLSGSEWNGLANLRQQNNRMWKESWSLDGEIQNGSFFDISLAPGETRKYVLSGTNLAVGYLVINKAGGRIPAQGEILVSFFYKFLDQSSALVDSIGVSESIPATDYFFTVEKTDLVDTGYAFASFNRRNDFRISMTLYNQRGEPAGAHEFRYSGHRSQFFSEFFSIDPDFIGSVSLRSEELINLTVIRLESQSSGFQLTNVPPTSILRLSSPDISMGQTISDKFSCKESDTSPALHWNRLPSEVASWALVLEDPDVSEKPFVHWIMFDIPGTYTFLQQDEVPTGAKLANNDFGEQDYRGPCAPAGPAHRYFFKLYGLDVATLNLDNPNIDELLNAMENHVISSAQLMGIWAR